jgi:hypothetical protein
LGSGEGEQEFRAEGGEDGRKSWESKLTFLLATFHYAVGLGNIWPLQCIDQKIVGYLNRCIIYCYPTFCEKFRSDLRQLVVHSSLYYTYCCVFTCYSHLEVYFSSDKFENNEMGGACSAYGTEERRTHGLGGETAWEA